MDLTNLIPTTDTIEVVITHPSTFETLLNEDGSEMTITVYATHSKEYKAVIYEQQNIRLKQMQGKRSRKGGITMTAEDLDESVINTLAKTTKEWNITFKGEKPKLTVEKAKEVYSTIPHLINVIEEGVADAEVFTPA